MFSPDEIIFAPVSECNLACSHCNVKRTEQKLSVKHAVRFLRRCRDAGIDRVGFSGGEPFLAHDFLCRLSAVAVKEDMFFDRLMTNAVWFRNKSRLLDVLAGLYDSGFDGKFGISVDAYHRQDVKKIALFIRCVEKIWQEQTRIELVCVSVPGDAAAARHKINTLAGFLGIKSADLNIVNIDLSPVDNAVVLADPWSDGEWFKDDMCAGPGNVFYVHPDGNTAVCCGYANQETGLIVGNIKNDTPQKMIERASDSKFISTVYSCGLEEIRNKLQANGVEFPGKTLNHCFFCWYLLKNFSGAFLETILEK